MLRIKVAVPSGFSMVLTISPQVQAQQSKDPIKGWKASKIKMQIHPEPSRKQVRVSPPSLHPPHEVPPAFLFGGNTEVVCKPCWWTLHSYHYGWATARRDDRVLEQTSSVLSTWTLDSLKGGGGDWRGREYHTTLFPLVILALQQILGKQVQKNNVG